VEFHPIANIFPMMSGEELSELAESIESNGLRVPILLYEGKILDGRNRYQACESSGVKPEYTEFEGDDPLSHVLDLNLHRRHLTSGQRAIVVAEAQTVGSGRFKNRNIAVLPTQEGLAKALNVSSTYVREVKGIQQKSPDHYQQVKSGELSIPQAKRKIERERVEKLKSDSGVSPHVRYEHERFDSIADHILKAKVKSEGWQYTDDSVLFHTLHDRGYKIKRVHKNAVCVLRNLEALMDDLSAEMVRQGWEEKVLEAQIIEPTEAGQDGQQTIAGLLEGKHVQDGKD
jgi:hypothetical protein